MPEELKVAEQQGLRKVQLRYPVEVLMEEYLELVRIRQSDKLAERLV